MSHLHRTQSPPTTAHPTRPVSRDQAARIVAGGGDSQGRWQRTWLLRTRIPAMTDMAPYSSKMEPGRGRGWSDVAKVDEVRWR